MTIFSITWAEYCEESAHRIIAIRHPAAPLAVTVCGDVIVNCDWWLGHEPEPAPDSFWQRLFDAGLKGREQAVEVKLLAQGTAFRRRVWDALNRIPCGETLSYAALAKAVASSPRAVGNACRANPYAPIIPCHRVVSASGLGGYCGATDGVLLDVKRKLLALEREYGS